MHHLKKYLAEFIGTAVLVLMGCGSAMFIGVSPNTVLPIALAFGLSIVAMAYVIGNISGCHVNPAVSLAMLLNKKLGIVDFVGYVAAQVAGAIAGAGLLKYISGVVNYDATGSLGSNGFSSLGVVGALIVEVVLTFIFIFTILGVTSDDSKKSVAGIVIGLTLAFVHIVGILLTGTSVNPARSLAPAIFAGGTALSDVWVFIVAPLVGAVLAFGAYRLLNWKKKAS